MQAYIDTNSSVIQMQAHTRLYHKEMHTLFLSLACTHTHTHTHTHTRTHSLTLLVESDYATAAASQLESSVWVSPQTLKVFSGCYCCHVGCFPLQLHVGVWASLWFISLRNRTTKYTSVTSHSSLWMIRWGSMSRQGWHGWEMNKQTKILFSLKWPPPQEVRNKYNKTIKQKQSNIHTNNKQLTCKTKTRIKGRTEGRKNARKKEEQDGGRAEINSFLIWHHCSNLKWILKPTSAPSQ